MKNSPGRKERRREFFHGNPQEGHGQPNPIAIGVMKPTKKVNTNILTLKRIEMLKKHPDKILPSERKILDGQEI
jgi:hypothetical protein